MSNAPQPRLPRAATTRAVIVPRAATAHTAISSSTQQPRLYDCRRSFHVDTDLTGNTRAPHFTPKHWLLCQMGLY